jgi:hypothetical protein
MLFAGHINAVRPFFARQDFDVICGKTRRPQVTQRAHKLVALRRWSVGGKL